MCRSRRSFLHSIVGGAATGIALQWPLAGLSRTGSFEPPQLDGQNPLIRLNRNENAYGPSPKVADVIRSSVGSANRYPYVERAALTEQIAHFHHVKPEQVLFGCGSTEILRIVAFAFLGSGKQLIQASPTFQGMEHYARAAGSEVLLVPLTRTYAHDVDGMLARATASTTVAYICNPNNPTASLTPRKDVESLISKLPATTYIVIDEAYHQYAGHSGMYASFIDSPVDDERVIVVRTFSKVYGLAGLRLGYAVALPKVIHQMLKFATEDNVNAAVAQAAAAALDDTNGVNESVQRNANDRQNFFNSAMGRTLKPINSHANFVMMNTYHPTEQVIQDFRKNNIVIGPHFPAMDTYIRVSLGRPEEMVAFWRTWDSLPYTKGLMTH